MITLASDFGSPYPAAMKGVVLQQTDTRLVDVSHDLPRGAVRESAFWRREVLPTFPPATHLAVVDPGVGTGRGVLVAQAGEHTLVGPDNGLLVPAARRLADEVDWFHADAGDPASSTFHGRDVFAPLAATVHDAVAADEAALAGHERLTRIDAPVDCQLPEATIDDDSGGTRGWVLAVDDFGNVVTNVPGNFLDGKDAVRVNGERVPVAETFGAVDPGSPLAVVGSHGYVECDVNGGHGDEWFGLSPGNDVHIEDV